MLTRSSWSILVSILVLGLAMGCGGDDGDTIIQGGGVTYPGSYPGNDAVDNNHAPDGQAFSANGESVYAGPRVFYSSVANRGIILYGTVDVTGTPLFSLWASYFDGASVTPPVEIVTVGVDRGQGAKQGNSLAPVYTNGAVVMFYQPSGVPGNTYPANDGDAVILFSRWDVDDSGPAPGMANDSNIRLWWCYFDRSKATQPGEAYGFGTFDLAGDFRPGYADVVDPDDGENDNTNQPDNKVPDNVQAFGVVSDGLLGQALFAYSTDPSSQGPLGFYQQTDFRDYLVAVWTQMDEVDAAPGLDRPDRHLWWARFSFDLPGSGAPGFDTPRRIATDASSPENSGNPLDEGQTAVFPPFPPPPGLPPVFPLFTTYNNSIVFLISEDTDGDMVYEYNHYTGDSTNGFSQGAFLPNSIELSPDNDAGDGDFAFVSELPSIYGGDHNLERVVVLFGHSENHGDDDDADIYIARFDPTQVTVPSTFNPTNDRTQVDLTGLDPGVGNGQDVFEFDSRISRDSDYILIVFRQADSAPSPGTRVDLKAVRYLTDEIGGTPPPLIGNSVGQPVDISDPGVNANVPGFQFQGELGTAFIPPREIGVTGVRRSAVQSDNTRMHIIYELNDDSMGTPVDQLHVTQYELPGPLSDGIVRPDTMDDFPDQSITLNPTVLEEMVRMLDDGQGGVVIYYYRDQNFKVPGTLDPDLRFNARHFDGNFMSPPEDLNNPDLQIAGANVGAITVGTADPAGSMHLLFFNEDRYATSGGGPASSSAVRFRRFDKLGAGDLFGASRFTPIQTVDTGQSVDAAVIGGTTRGGTGDAGIYIEQGGHLYYNEYTPATDTWKDAADLIVDHDSSTDILAGLVFGHRPYLPPDLATSGETQGSLVFWYRLDNDGDLRIHLRIHH